MDLSKGYLNTKIELGVAKHFLEVIKKREFKQALKLITMCGIFSNLKLHCL